MRERPKTTFKRETPSEIHDKGGWAYSSLGNRHTYLLDDDGKAHVISRKAFEQRFLPPNADEMPKATDSTPEVVAVAPEIPKAVAVVPDIQTSIATIPQNPAAVAVRSEISREPEGVIDAPFVRGDDSAGSVEGVSSGHGGDKPAGFDNTADVPVAPLEALPAVTEPEDAPAALVGVSAGAGNGPAAYSKGVPMSTPHVPDMIFTSSNGGSEAPRAVGLGGERPIAATVPAAAGDTPTSADAVGISGGADHTEPAAEEPTVNTEQPMSVDVENVRRVIQEEIAKGDRLSLEATLSDLSELIENSTKRSGRTSETIILEDLWAGIRAALDVGDLADRKSASGHIEKPEPDHHAVIAAWLPENFSGDAAATVATVAGASDEGDGDGFPVDYPPENYDYYSSTWPDAETGVVEKKSKRGARLMRAIGRVAVPAVLVVALLTSSSKQNITPATQDTATIESGSPVTAVSKGGGLAANEATKTPTPTVAFMIPGENAPTYTAPTTTTAPMATHAPTSASVSTHTPTPTMEQRTPTSQPKETGTAKEVQVPPTVQATSPPTAEAFPTQTPASTEEAGSSNAVHNHEATPAPSATSQVIAQKTPTKSPVAASGEANTAGTGEQSNTGVSPSPTETPVSTAEKGANMLIVHKNDGFTDLIEQTRPELSDNQAYCVYLYLIGKFAPDKLVEGVGVYQMSNGDYGLASTGSVKWAPGVKEAIDAWRP